LQPNVPATVPMPQLLDPHRLLSRNRDDMTNEDHRSYAQELADALVETTEYGQQLWRQLDQHRTYLLQMLPPDPRDPDATGPWGARPTGPDDDAGWEAWIEAYTDATSVLAGTHGDSGHGRSEARLVAQFRRDIPPDRRAGATAPPPPAAAEPEPAHDSSPEPEKSSSRWRQAGIAVLALLALRGLRKPKPRQADPR
jgi:hypothetical protein